MATISGPHHAICPYMVCSYVTCLCAIIALDAVDRSMVIIDLGAKIAIIVASQHI